MQAALQGGSARAARVAHGVAVVAVRVHLQDDGPVVHGVALGVRHALRMAGRVGSTILTCCSPLVKLECAFLGSSTGAPTFGCWTSSSTVHAHLLGLPGKTVWMRRRFRCAPIRQRAHVLDGERVHAIDLEAGHVVAARVVCAALAAAPVRRAHACCRSKSPRQHITPSPLQLLVHSSGGSGFLSSAALVAPVLMA